MIRKKEFAVAILYLKDKTFVVYVIFLTSFDNSDIHLSCKSQIVLLMINKILIAIFPNILILQIFFLELIVKLLEYTRINKHIINLINSKSLSYQLIYNLGLIELESLKLYTKTNLANGFIKAFKSLTNTLIFFIWKFKGNFHLYVNYQSFNNLIIKNIYLLLLIGKSLD